MKSKVPGATTRSFVMLVIGCVGLFFVGITNAGNNNTYLGFQRTLIETSDLQDSCGTKTPRPEVLQQVATALAQNKAKRRSAAEQAGMPSSDAALAQPPGSVIINVYFHVIQSTPGNKGKGFVSVPMLESQVDALNRDFSGSDVPTSGANTPFRFQYAGEDYTVNPAWFNVTQDSTEEAAMKAALRKGGLRDLNIFTTNNADSWATFPWEYDGNPSNDGIILSYTMLPGGKNSTNNLGDVATHEAGHWLGLLHTFETALDEQTCGIRNDEVDDTPAELQPTKQTYSCKKTYDTCPNLIGNDPTNNFMTYRSDVCMSGFTTGQSLRMDDVYTFFREAVTGVAYISNANSHNVSVIDTATNNVTATIPVGLGPWASAINPTGTRAYVTNLTDGTVSVIDTALNSVIATVPVGASPSGVAVNPAGTKVYVSNVNSHTVSVINTASNTVLTDITTGTCPEGLAVTPDGTRLYVVNSCSTNIAVIDTSNNTVIATIPTFTSAGGIVINSTGTRAYVANGGSDNILVVDTASNTIIETIQVPQGSGGYRLAINPAGTRVYTSNFAKNNVYVVDLASRSVIATIAVGQFPWGIGLNTRGNRIYVANFSSNTVSVINVGNNLVVDTISVGASPTVAFGQFVR
jgi:YVTN family beta-propeller protein